MLLLSSLLLPNHIQSPLVNSLVLSCDSQGTLVVLLKASFFLNHLFHFKSVLQIYEWLKHVTDDLSHSYICCFYNL